MRILTFFIVAMMALAGTIYAESPKRIISLSPNATTILVDLGIRDELVGVTRYCTPPAGTKPVIIGGFIDPSAETVISLRPDILIRANTKDRTFLIRMEKRGIPYLLLNVEGYENIKKDISLLGKSIGKEKEAEKILQEWAKTEEDIKKQLGKTPGAKPPKVLIKWGEVFAGEKSYLNDAIKLCGGINAVPSTKQVWPALSKEALINIGAELLICVMPDGPDMLTNSTEQAEKLRKMPEFSQLPAVRSGNVWIISENSGILYPSSRLLKALPQLAKVIEESRNKLHPTKVVE